jgi:hypothetical protein
MTLGSSWAKRVRAVAGFGCLFGIASSATLPASASEFGVGVVHWGENWTVLLPIKTAGLMLEPEIYYNKVKDDTTTTFTSTTDSFKGARYGLATGIYARSELAASFEGYFGGRVGLTRYKTDSTSGISTTTVRADSWFIAPTAGLQYYFIKQFSIGIDVGLVYESADQKIQSSTSEQTSDTKSLDTLTRILLRGYF